MEIYINECLLETSLKTQNSENKPGGMSPRNPLLPLDFPGSRTLHSRFAKVGVQHIRYDLGKMSIIIKKLNIKTILKTF